MHKGKEEEEDAERNTCTPPLFLSASLEWLRVKKHGGWHWCYKCPNTPVIATPIPVLSSSRNSSEKKKIWLERSSVFWSSPQKKIRKKEAENIKCMFISISFSFHSMKPPSIAYESIPLQAQESQIFYKNVWQRINESKESSF